jgi:hypothetical protein
MTEKWAREARDVIPEVYAQVVNNLTDLQGFVARYRPGEKAIAVLSKEKAKLGPGWRAALLWRPAVSPWNLTRPEGPSPLL